MFEDFSKLLNSYLGWHVENGEVMPPHNTFPQFVVDRIEYINCEDNIDMGMTSYGAVKFILGAGENEELEKEWNEFSTNEWLPVSKEFEDWMWNSGTGRINEMKIMVAVVYGLWEVDK